MVAFQVSPLLQPDGVKNFTRIQNWTLTLRIGLAQMKTGAHLTCPEYHSRSRQIRLEFSHVTILAQARQLIRRPRQAKNINTCCIIRLRCHRSRSADLPCHQSRSADLPCHQTRSADLPCHQTRSADLPCHQSRSADLLCPDQLTCCVQIN